MRTRLLYALLLILVLPVGCFSPRNTVQKPSVLNLSKMYNPVNTRLHPAYTIYNNSSTTTLLLIKVFPVELLYSGTIEPNKILGQLKVSYTLTDIENPEKPVPADSGQMVYTFARENADKKFVTQMVLKTMQGRKYQLLVTARDMVRNEENLACLYIDRTSALSGENFLVTEAESSVPIFLPNVVGNQLFKLDYADRKEDWIFVKYFAGEAPLPRPSFSEGTEREYMQQPDSLWMLPFSRGTVYQLNYPGTYLFQLDTTRAEGLTLFSFNNSFPRVQQVDQLIPPLAYLTTTPEYDNIRKAANQKLAVDNFWLEKAGSADRARELIRVYYNRVYFANFYFTSYKPGWSTDRGMIFIIYGPPQSVKVLPDQEKWIYYKNNYTTTVTFTFFNKPSPFVSNHYVLQRSDSYDSYWRSAVDTWRNGKIYLIE